MVLSAKWSKSNGGDHFLLVLFPEEDQDSTSSSNNNNNANNSPSTTSPTSSLYHQHNHNHNHNITKKKNKKKLSISSLISLSSPSPSSSSSFFSANNNRLISKAQSTLSICGLLVFTTFLVFTLSTFEPTTAAAISRRSSTSSSHLHRRILLRSNPSPPPPLPFRISNYFFRRRPQQTHPQSTAAAPPPALQGMGRLYRRGTRSMSDLIVAHLSDSDDGETSLLRIRSFLRILHNAGVLSRSDLVFLFSSPSSSDKLSRAIADENDSFIRLLVLSSAATESNRTNTDLPQGLRRYMGRTGAGHKDAIWGKGTGPPAWVAGSENGNGNGTRTEHDDDPTRPSYGSVVGFDAMELDPENSLSGFVDGVTMGLRRWACYPMLLGRVRRKYKHMALVAVDDFVVFNDPFSRVRTRSPESVFLWTTNTNTNTHPETEDTASETGKQRSKKAGSHHHHTHHHHRHGDDQKQQQPPVGPGIVVGGTRGVRRLSDAVVTEIVRASMDGQHPHGSRGGKTKEKGANSGSAAAAAVSEAGIVNQLVRGDRGMLSKKVELVVNDGGEPIPDATELAAAIVSDGAGKHAAAVAQWGRSNIRDESLGLGVGSFRGINGVIIKGLCCLSELQSAVYRDCLSAPL